MKNKPGLTLLLVLILTVLGLWIALPEKIDIQLNLAVVKIAQTWDRTQLPTPLNKWLWPLRTGLDIQGGSHLLFTAEMQNVTEADRSSALESTKNTIERRVNLLGVSEAVVQTAQVGDKYRLIVELPGISDVSEAVKVVGETAQLDFRKVGEATSATQLKKSSLEMSGSTDITETDNPKSDSSSDQIVSDATSELTEVVDGSSFVMTTFKTTDLTGRDLVRANVDFDRNTGKPVVALEFNSQGTEKFARLTTELVGKQLAIFLDDFPVSIPSVN